MPRKRLRRTDAKSGRNLGSDAQDHSSGQSTTNSIPSPDEQIAALIPDFSEYQARLTESIMARKTAWHRIHVHIELGVVKLVQQIVEDRRDLPRSDV